MDYKEVYQEWLESPYFDEETKRSFAVSPGMTKRSRNVSMQSWSLAPQDFAALSVQEPTV